VAIVARNEDSLNQAGAEIAEAGARWIPISADLRVEGEVDRAVSATVDEFGAVDILVACAGGAPAGGLFDLSSSQWSEGFQTKILAYHWAVKAVVPHMRTRTDARIVLMSGNGGKQPSPYALAIGVTGAAINNLVRGLAEELGPMGIGVVSVSPGRTETQRWPALRAAIAARGGISEEQAEVQVLQGIPMGRLASPEEVGDLVAYLASPRARYITGVSVLIDGGATKAI
jgi:NAD(P)-dependent dehydrogenase (short-subunit alcohol dehydrogenase family)